MRNLKTAYKHNIIELFESQVQLVPQYLAISERDKQVSYNSLNGKANQLANCLKKHQVCAGEFVGILLEPGIDFIVSMLAVVKLGAAYLPLDALAPPGRLVEILDDAQPKLVITNEQYLPLIGEDKGIVHLIKNLNMESISFSRENLAIPIAPASPLYMMYTSGSTGRPKGVIVPHQAVVNLVSEQNDFRLRAGDVIAQFSNLAFDASPFEVWSALLNGANLAIVPYAIRTEPAQLKQFIAAHQVGYLCLPTGFFHQLIKSAVATLDGIRVIVFGGEQVNVGLLKKFLAYRKERALAIELINGYGPTEATAYACRQRVDEHSLLSDDLLSSIGTPINNVKMYVLDENKQPVTEGELYVSGINLALGYHNAPKQNDEKFITNPFCQTEPFQRLYKTGDRVRQLASGEYLFLERFDDQVKIGGFRIHLNEIETQLMRFPGISLAAVKVEIGGGSHKMLTAYIILSTQETAVSADELRNFLSEVLPPYMLPAKYVMVEELPLTLVGKVDKSKLDSLPHTDLSFHVDTSSSSMIEEAIKKIWQHLLNRKVIDVHKNLFELGANSLLIAEACSKINKELQSELQVADIFSHPTIYKLSCYLEGQIEVPTLKTSKDAVGNEVAIVGMSCRFPGANSLQEYWDNLCLGKESLQRFEQEQLLNQTGSVAEKHFVPVRGILRDIEQFDANFFGFNPGDAQIADPQQRVFLECAWEALEHAAIAPEKLAAQSISVFAGMSDSTYLQENLLKSTWFNKEHDPLQQRIATSASMLSTQVSYRLNLKGRSINVNTSCSTGLATVDHACQDLILGYSDIALAGAASIVVPQTDAYVYQHGSIVSPDGHCRPFSDVANGTVFSNGVGVVILKRLADALADGDTIYAVIKGRGVNNDGSDKLGFTAPSTRGQMSCIRDALGQAQIKADEVGYLEAHGTATALGDVVEVGALTAVYREQTERKQFCCLGSVKGNIGHTDVTSGIAGLIKVALCLHHRQIPPMCGFLKPNPALFLQDSPFVINTQLQDWQVMGGQRYAGVSSFGVGGTNIHMVLSEHSQEPSATVVNKEQLLIISAKNKRALQQNTEKLVQYLMVEAPAINLADVAYTLQKGREDFSWRRFAVGKSVDELIHGLSQSPIVQCHEHSPNVVFMFPGQGTQYPLMAMTLMEKVPFFALLVEQGINLAQNYINCDLLELIRTPGDARLNQTQYAQPILFIIEYALAQLLMSYGVKPDVLIGHSIGEYVAACLAGVFSFEDAIIMVCERGLLMASVERGDMLAIECTAEEFRAYQQLIAIELALHNASNHCVASGSAAEISALIQHLSSLGKHYQKLQVSHAFHSRFMESVERPFKEMLTNISLSAPTIPIISNVTGTWLSKEEATNPDYWYRHMRHTVNFCGGLHTALADTRSFFIEVGPGRSLSTFLKEVAGRELTGISMTQILAHYPAQPRDYQQLMSALGALWQQGIHIDWNSVHAHEKRQRIPLPTYAFQRQRYWVEPDNVMQRAASNQQMYVPAWSHQPAYLQSLALNVDDVAAHSWIIVYDRQGFASQIVDFLGTHGVTPISVEFAKEYVAHSASHFSINAAEKTHYETLFKTLKNSLQRPIVVHLSSCDNTSQILLHNDEVEQQLALGFHSLLYLTQAYLQQVGEQVPLQCALVTRGTQSVLGTETMVPANASLIGACRAIMHEHPTLRYRVFDLHSDELATDSPLLVNELVHSCMQGEWVRHRPITAYRHGFRWELAYTESKASVAMNRFKDEGVYLVTGGIGGMALSLCEAITKNVARPTFILLSRSPVIAPPTWAAILQDSQHPLYAKVSRLQQLQDLGARLFCHQVDVNQETPLCEAIAYYKQQLGRIDGVIHAAGIAGSGLVQLKTKAKADAVLAPKLQGTYNLARALQGIPLDFVVLISSLAAITGVKGQIDYCAANASLDAFACTRLFSTRFILSLNWNSWREVGMAVETQRPHDVHYLGHGNDISPAEGQQLFLQAMARSHTQVIISNYEPEGYSMMLLQTPLQMPMAQPKMTRHELNVSTSYEVPSNEVESQLAQLWQDNLGIEEVGIHDDFFALGGYSLKALSLIEKINKMFVVSVSIHHLYTAPTIRQLAQLIQTNQDCR
ncbi:MAG: D-alanine--D-alanyl carrier protein ligase [Legionella sp.]|uniref:amino acid adenylation domain-containing protein n=1 Tax=Legionella sp. TaxID=459 RepID=UPI003D143044